MNVSNYRRRVRRLEREINAADSAYLLDKYVPGNFIMFTVPLPVGTEVPEGSRIVKDFYPFLPRDPAARGFTASYWRGRITADPGAAQPEENFDASGAPAEKPDKES